MRAFGSATTRTRNMSESRQRAPTVFAGSPPKDTKTAFREARSASAGRVRSPDRRPLQRTLSKNLNKTPAPKTSLAPGQVMVTAVPQPTFICVLALTKALDCSQSLDPESETNLCHCLCNLMTKQMKSWHCNKSMTPKSLSSSCRLVMLGHCSVCKLNLQPPCHLACLSVGFSASTHLWPRVPRAHHSVLCGRKLEPRNAGAASQAAWPAILAAQLS